MRLTNTIVYFIILMLFIGCSEKPVFAKKINIEGDWTYSKELSYAIEIDQLDDTYDLILSLTYGTDFAYQNIYVKIKTQYPNGKEIKDVLSLNLTNGSGLFLGDCSSSRCVIDLLLQENFKFTEKGKYEITIIQNGREENLEDVYAAELKLYKLK